MSDSNHFYAFWWFWIENWWRKDCRKVPDSFQLSANTRSAVSLTSFPGGASFRSTWSAAQIDEQRSCQIADSIFRPKKRNLARQVASSANWHLPTTNKASIYKNIWVQFKNITHHLVTCETVPRNPFFSIHSDGVKTVPPEIREWSLRPLLIRLHASIGNILESEQNE